MGWGPSVRSGTVRGPTRKFRTGQRILGEVRVWLGDPRGSPGQVGGPTQKFGTGRGTLGEV